MPKALNFTKVQKSYLPVTFADEKKTTILVGTPTKAIMDELTVLYTNIEELGEDAASNNTEELFEACAKIMSRNKTGVKISRDFLEQVFDYEDIIIFFRAYMEFIGEVIGQKN